ncbi:CWF19-like protein 1 homolog [Bradysia coprophila]|uniref:CWF19-like protein 1 homolog n=1 Tax=Bradysia coprophila TaxID=38358 RepID=UPI00187D93F4|nr:CWF19-like protein 1 homolog [Bradysia coprophila]
MDQKQKILVCGDVKGNFKQLFGRVESINKKSGPFEMLLCVGDFFGDNNDELIAFKNGNKVIPVPTYILGPNEANACPEYENLNEGEICSNLTYLGKRGLYTISSGIKIAYLSGIEAEKSDWSFDTEDVKAVRNSCFINKTSMGEYRGIDILLTSQWPFGVDDKKADKDESQAAASSKLLSWLAREIKPRYHFVGINGRYFERLPYRNSTGSNTQLELATRFIGLAAVGNEEKAKYIYALSIAPVDKMRLMDLIQKTTDETPCPYDSINLMKDVVSKSENNSAQFFYDTNSFNDDGDRNSYKKRKGLGADGDRKRQRHVFDQEKCWFCLSSPSVEKHMVISVGDNFYLALAKGPLDENNILISSVTHIQSSSLLAEDDWKELEKFKDALRKCFKAEKKVVTFFERNYKSSHLLINVVAVHEDAEWRIKHSFDDCAEAYNLNLETLPRLSEPTQLPGKGPYFYAELPDNSTLLTRQMKQFPLHFGREVFCSDTLLKCEQKIDWRECTISKEEETALVKRFREKFQPFDFTL